jgi:hypothetical protein
MQMQTLPPLGGKLRKLVQAVVGSSRRRTEEGRGREADGEERRKEEEGG